MNDQKLKKIRTLFPNYKKRAYFMHGFMAQSPLPVIQTAKGMQDLSPENHISEKFLQGLLGLNEARQLFASLVGAHSSEIAITQNTTEGINLAAELIDLPEGSNVIVTEIEHPCSTYPWLLRKEKGIELRFVPADNHRVSIDAIRQQMDHNTRVIHLSHVSHSTGQRYDLNLLGQLAHENNAYLIIDASQSAGILSLDLNKNHVDFLATCGYKWLLGPVGTGFLYIRKELCERFNSTHAGWRTSPDPLTLNSMALAPPKDASKFEMGGMPNITGVAALNQGMKIIDDFGIGMAERVVLDLSGYCIDRLQELDLKIISPIAIKERSSLIVIEIENAEQVRKYLAENNVFVSATPTANYLRIDLHFYNSESEVDRLIEALGIHLSIPVKRRRGWLGF